MNKKRIFLSVCVLKILRFIRRIWAPKKLISISYSFFFFNGSFKDLFSSSFISALPCPFHPFFTLFDQIYHSLILKEWNTSERRTSWKRRNSCVQERFLILLMPGMKKKTRKIIHQVKECAGFYSIRIETRTNVCCCFSATYLIPLTSPLVRTPSSKTTNDYAKFCPTWFSPSSFSSFLDETTRGRVRPSVSPSVRTFRVIFEYGCFWG